MPQYAKISGAASGDNEVIAAVAGKKIRILGLVIVAAGAVTVYFKSGSTAICGDATNPMSLAANGGFVLPTPPAYPTALAPSGYMQTSAGEAFNMTLGGAVSVGGCVVYELID